VIIFLKLNDLKKLKRLFCLTTFVGIILFMILLFIAIFTYPVPYSFWGHYLSVLGKTRTDFGLLANPISSILFFVALIILGTLFIPFWVILQSSFNKKDNRDLSFWGTVFGVISSLSLIGVAIYPSDIDKNMHNFFATGFFLSLAAAILLYSIVMLNYKYNSKYYAYIGFLVLILTFFHIFSSISRPFFQKLSVFGFIAWIVIQTIKIWKLIDIENDS